MWSSESFYRERFTETGYREIKLDRLKTEQARKVRRSQVRIDCQSLFEAKQSN